MNIYYITNVLPGVDGKIGIVEIKTSKREYLKEVYRKLHYYHEFQRISNELLNNKKELGCVPSLNFLIAGYFRNCILHCEKKIVVVVSNYLSIYNDNI